MALDSMIKGVKKLVKRKNLIHQNLKEGQDIKQILEDEAVVGETKGGSGSGSQNQSISERQDEKVSDNASSVYTGVPLQQTIGGDLYQLPLESIEESAD